MNRKGNSPPNRSVYSWRHAKREKRGLKGPGRYTELPVGVESENMQHNCCIEDVMHNANNQTMRSRRAVKGPPKGGRQKGRPLRPTTRNYYKAGPA